MTVVVGAPDWGEVVQAPFVAFNQGGIALPLTATIDCARWPCSYVELTADTVNSASVTMQAQWSDVNGVALTYPITLYASLPGAAGVSLRMIVEHLGPTVQFTLTGAGTNTQLKVTHQNFRPYRATPYTPGMEGVTIATAASALGAGASLTSAARGTGNAETSASRGYVGPALLVLSGTAGAACCAEILDASGSTSVGGVSLTSSNITPGTVSALVVLPPTQYSIRRTNGGTAQTVTATLIAT